jgi:hypothetical protein
MPLYYFKLVDSHIVVDYGVHDLLDETVAQILSDKARPLHSQRAAGVSGQILLHFRHSRRWCRHLPQTNRRHLACAAKPSSLIAVRAER